MSLKMLGVCSSRRDQQFWLLNHSISSSYEEVMIKVSKQKSRTFLQNFRFNVVKLLENGGKRSHLKEKEEGHFCPTNTSHFSLVPVWGSCTTRDQRACWALWHTAPTRGWPWCSSRAPLTFFSRFWASELRF